MEARKLHIFTAIELEAGAIRRILRKDLPHKGIPNKAHAHWPPIDLRIVGIRAVHLPDLTSLNPLAIIMAGLAGALDPALRIGDIVIDDSVPLLTTPSHPPGHEHPGEPGRPRPATTGSGTSRLPLHLGRIHTAEHLVSTPQQKSDLFRQTGALAVEMENAIVRAAATKAGIPFIGIRAISDTALVNLDPALLALVDEMGRPRPAAIAAQVLRHPRSIGALHRLGVATRLATRNLAQAVAWLLDEKMFRDNLYKSTGQTER